MEKEKLVSIITPCYNGEKYVENFLNSLLDQEYSHMELIFVDDGSTDRTKEILFSYQEAFDKKGIELIYIYQENAGQAAAINQGLAVFKGEYLMWVDSDDILLKKNVSEKVRFLETHSDMDFVLCAGEKVLATDLEKSLGKIERVRPKQKDDLFSDYIYEKNVVFAPITVMVKREAYEKVIPQHKIYPGREGQNWQLMLPLAYSCRWGYIEEVLFKYVVHADSHSHTKRSYEEHMNRLKGFERILVETIQSMAEMPQDEKKSWIFKVHEKYLHVKVYWAYNYGKYEDAAKYKKELGNRKKIRDSFIYCKSVYMITKIWRKQS